MRNNNNQTSRSRYLVVKVMYFEKFSQFKFFVVETF